jgi:hypothetical protein
LARVRASVDVAAPVEAAEELWYDTRRWPSFIDGFGHVSKLEGDWPGEGSRVVWESTPRGRGRVVERVVSHEPGRGQALEVEDPRLRGTQRVVFEPLEGGCAIGLELRYELKERGPLQVLTDLFFIRRALRDALRRTLVRFARELAADRELLR